MRGQVLSGTNLSECRSLYHSINQKDLFLDNSSFLGVGFSEL